MDIALDELREKQSIHFFVEFHTPGKEITPKPTPGERITPKPREKAPDENLDLGISYEVGSDEDHSISCVLPVVDAST